jgi:VPDSG-CTERM motif
VDQVFYMGDGSAQSLTVPVGATRLYIGTMDGYDYYNDLGAFAVDFTEGVTESVPDTGSTLTMLGVAFGAISFVRRKR